MSVSSIPIDQGESSTALLMSPQLLSSATLGDWEPIFAVRSESRFTTIESGSESELTASLLSSPWTVTNRTPSPSPSSWRIWLARGLVEFHEYFLVEVGCLFLVSVDPPYQTHDQRPVSFNRLFYVHCISVMSGVGEFPCAHAYRTMPRAVCYFGDGRLN